MNFSKLFLMLAFGVSLSNVVCGMEQDDLAKKFRGIEIIEQPKKKYRDDLSRQLLNEVMKTNCNIKLVTSLLETNREGFCADVNTQNHDKYTPLHFVAFHGTKECIQILIDNGANVKAKNNYKSTPLHLALEYGNTECSIKLLIKKGADVNVQDNDKWTPLHYALINRDISCVKLLIDNGADVNAQDKDNETPLHLAVRDCKIECAQLLIGKGANLNTQDSNKWTPLHYAADNGSKECVQLLIDNSAGVKALKAQDEDKWTPLHYAACNGKKEIATLLLEHMKNLISIEYIFNVDAKFQQHAYFVILCAKEFNKRYKHMILPKPILKVILIFGLKEERNSALKKLVNMKNNDRKTALDLAIEKGHNQIAEIIKKFKDENNLN